MRNLLFIILASFISLQNVQARDESAGDSHTTRLRRPKFTYEEKSEPTKSILPEFAKQELLSFEDRLLVPRKWKKRDDTK